MVLRRADRQQVFPVAQHKKRRFLALHEFLDHHFGTRRAKIAAEHVVNGRQCGVQIHRHDHPLAGGQTIGLDHNRCALLADICLGRFGIGEMAIGGGGGVHGGADFLGEGLGGFQLCCGLTRPETQDTGITQPVGHTHSKRSFGSDNYKINRVLRRKYHYRIRVHNIQIGRFGDHLNARIAGGHNQSITFRVLVYRPCQRMFAPATA